MPDALESGHQLSWQGRARRPARLARSRHIGTQWKPEALSGIVAERGVEPAAVTRFLIPIAAFLFFVQGAFVAAFGPRPQRFHAPLAALSAVWLAPLLIDRLFVDLVRLGTHYRLSPEMALASVSAMAMAVIGAWAARRRRYS